MGGCPSVHEHPEFQSSFDPKDKVQSYEVEKLKNFLKSPSGHVIGEPLKGDLSPFKSFPRKHKSIRTVFILCRDCKKEALNPRCSFCGSEQHSMDDAVLFHVGSAHDQAYKEAKKAREDYQPTQ